MCTRRMAYAQVRPARLSARDLSLRAGDLTSSTHAGDLALPAASTNLALRRARAACARRHSHEGTMPVRRMGMGSTASRATSADVRDPSCGSPHLDIHLDKGCVDAAGADAQRTGCAMQRTYSRGSARGSARGVARHTHGHGGVTRAKVGVLTAPSASPGQYVPHSTQPRGKLPTLTPAPAAESVALSKAACDHAYSFDVAKAWLMNMEEGEADSWWYKELKRPEVPRRSLSLSSRPSTPANGTALVVGGANAKQDPTVWLRPQSFGTTHTLTASTNGTPLIIGGAKQGPPSCLRSKSFGTTHSHAHRHNTALTSATMVD